MKKILIVLLAVAILATAGIALAGISGTPHDLSGGTGTLEPCAFCHTPHQGNIGIYPLWNRSQTAPNYTVYTSTTFDMGAAQQSLDAGSAPCMVCHNGVASDLVNYPGRGSTSSADYNVNSTDLSTWTNLGTNLQNEHPVSFTYNASKDTSTQNNGFPTSNGGTIPATGINFPLYPVNGATTSPTEFSCATCHTVHHTPVAAYSAGAGTVNQVYFLRTTNASSKMCAACHTNRW